MEGFHSQGVEQPNPICSSTDLGQIIPGEGEKVSPAKVGKHLHEGGETLPS